MFLLDLQRMLLPLPRITLASDHLLLIFPEFVRPMLCNYRTYDLNGPTVQHKFNNTVQQNVHNYILTYILTYLPAPPNYQWNFS